MPLPGSAVRKRFFTGEQSDHDIDDQNGSSCQTSRGTNPVGHWRRHVGRRRGEKTKRKALGVLSYRTATNIYVRLMNSTRAQFHFVDAAPFNLHDIHSSRMWALATRQRVHKRIPYLSTAGRAHERQEETQSPPLRGPTETLPPQHPGERCISAASTLSS